MGERNAKYLAGRKYLAGIVEKEHCPSRLADDWMRGAAEWWRPDGGRGRARSDLACALHAHMVGRILLAGPHADAGSRSGGQGGGAAAAKAAKAAAHGATGRCPA